jgi:hypothetical protein
VDISGVHQIKVIPCVCKDQPLDMQYMDMGLFPASFKQVSSAFTFQVLDDQRLDHLECKTSLLKYWTKLCRKTSPDDWDWVPVCPHLLCLSVQTQALHRIIIGRCSACPGNGGTSKTSCSLGSGMTQTRNQVQETWLCFVPHAHSRKLIYPPTGRRTRRSW